MKPEIVDPVRDAEQLDVVLLSPPYDFPPRVRPSRFPSSASA